MNTLNTIQQVLAEKFGIPRDRLSPEQPLEELGIDSLSMTELMFLLEERLGIRFSDDAMPLLKTLQDVANLAEGLKVKANH